MHLTPFGFVQRSSSVPLTFTILIRMRSSATWKKALAMSSGISSLVRASVPSLRAFSKPSYRPYFSSRMIPAFW